MFTVNHKANATLGVLLNEVDSFFVSIVVGLLFGADTLDYSALGIPDLLALRLAECLPG